MSEMIDLGPEDGIIKVKAPDGTERELDLWEINARLSEHHKSQQGRPDTEFWPGVVELIASYGLPRVSQRVAARFLAKVNEAVEKSLFREGGDAGSPDSTASTPELSAGTTGMSSS